jgi:hypothetical protein
VYPPKITEKCARLSEKDSNIRYESSDARDDYYTQQHRNNDHGSSSSWITEDELAQLDVEKHGVDFTVFLLNLHPTKKH